MTATMSRHLIVHQYCFQSSNSLWAVLHMPEEREQRIHFVRLSPCSLFTQDIGVETAGRWAVGVGVACSLVAGERGEVPVFVFCVSVRGAGFVFTRVFPVAYDLVSRVGRLCLISCHGPVVSPQSCALAARLPTLVPAPRPRPPARPPCRLRLGAWGWARPRV